MKFHSTEKLIEGKLRNFLFFEVENCVLLLFGKYNKNGKRNMYTMNYQV